MNKSCFRQLFFIVQDDIIVFTISVKEVYMKFEEHVWNDRKTEQLYSAVQKTKMRQI